MNDLQRWQEDAAAYGWIMPTAPWYARLPIIRHLRAAHFYRKVTEWNSHFRAIGRIPTGYDEWVIYGIATGRERKP